MRMFNSLRRRWGRWLIGAIVVLVVLVIGGPFVFFHFIEGPAPAPLSLSSGTSTTVAAGSGSSSATAGSVSGVWDVTNGSQAGYRVKEILFGQSHTAVGRTSGVTGRVTIAGTTVKAATFSVDLTKVTSDQSIRDEQFQSRIMDTASFPTATFTLTRPISLGTVPAQRVEVTETVTGNLTMHGATRSVTFHLQARRSGGKIEVAGSVPITFAEWNIANPSGGPAQTSNSGTMEFLLDLVPA